MKIIISPSCLVVVILSNWKYTKKWMILELFNYGIYQTTLWRFTGFLKFNKILHIFKMHSNTILCEREVSELMVSGADTRRQLLHWMRNTACSINTSQVAPAARLHKRHYTTITALIWPGWAVLKACLATLLLGQIHQSLVFSLTFDINFHLPFIILILFAQ